MKVNPWTHLTLLGFAVFNVAVGITLYFYYPTIPFTVISPTIPQPIWATIFLLSGITMLYGFLRRYYSLLRFMMVFGLFVKLMWEMGLLFRLNNGGAIFAVELWGMIAYFQLLGVIYFNPEVHNGGA